MIHDPQLWHDPQTGMVDPSEGREGSRGGGREGWDGGSGFGLHGGSFDASPSGVALPVATDRLQSTVNAAT